MESGDWRRTLSECEKLSERRLTMMRKIARETFAADPDYLVGVNGSVARRDCTSRSDVDLFFLFTGARKTDDARRAQHVYRERLRDAGLRMPAPGAVFEKPLRIEKLHETIGGINDKTRYITRRMLFFS